MSNLDPATALFSLYWFIIKPNVQNRINKPRRTKKFLLGERCPTDCRYTLMWKTAWGRLDTNGKAGQSSSFRFRVTYKKVRKSKKERKKKSGNEPPPKSHLVLSAFFLPLFKSTVLMYTLHTRLYDLFSAKKAFYIFMLNELLVVYIYEYMRTYIIRKVRIVVDENFWTQSITNNFS